MACRLCGAPLQGEAYDYLAASFGECRACDIQRLAINVQRMRMGNPGDSQITASAIDSLVDADALLSTLVQHLVAADNEAGVRTLTPSAGWKKRDRHATVHLFPPSDALDRPYYTLLTTGASACRMTIPDGYDEEDARTYPERCEFMTCLPADWPVAELCDHALTAGSWPRHMLCSLVEYVLDGNGAVHVGPNACIPSLTANPPGAPFFAGSKLAAVVTMEDLEEFELCIANDGLAVRVYYVLPLTAAEAAWKRRAGAAALYSAVGAKKPWNTVAIDYIIDNGRACAVTDGKCDARYEAEQALSPEQRAEAQAQRKRAEKAGYDAAMAAQAIAHS